MNDASEHLVGGRTDPTPAFTRISLLMVLGITVTAISLIFFDWIDLSRPGEVAPLLWFFTGLFILRVAGQILVALRPQQWLPPMEQWNLIPYPILLPIQLAFIVIMIWIDMAFAMNFGISTEKNQGIGGVLIIFSVIYASVMVIRYVVSMSRRRSQRWFGGTIPIVFHFVLASYLYVLGSFYAHP